MLPLFVTPLRVILPFPSLGAKYIFPVLNPQQEVFAIAMEDLPQ